MIALHSLLELRWASRRAVTYCSAEMAELSRPMQSSSFSSSESPRAGLVSGFSLREHEKIDERSWHGLLPKISEDFPREAPQLLLAVEFILPSKLRPISSAVSLLMFSNNWLIEVMVRAVLSSVLPWSQGSAWMKCSGTAKRARIWLRSGADQKVDFLTKA